MQIGADVGRAERDEASESLRLCHSRTFTPLATRVRAERRARSAYRRKGAVSRDSSAARQSDIGNDPSRELGRWLYGVAVQSTRPRVRFSAAAAAFRWARNSKRKEMTKKTHVRVPCYGCMDFRPILAG